MPQSAAPLFLARRSYRRRRLMDGARMLPVLGLILFLMPVLWSPAQTPEPDTGRSGIYLFAVWAGLIVLALALARGLAPALDEEERAEGSPEGGALPADGDEATRPGPGPAAAPDPRIAAAQPDALPPSAPPSNAPPPSAPPPNASPLNAPPSKGR